MKCGNCNNALEEKWTVCPYCETPVPKSCKCTGCGQELNPAWKACPFCQTKVGGSVSLKVQDSVVQSLSQSQDSHVHYHGGMPGSGDSQVVTKRGEFCHCCGVILDGRYFKCPQCGLQSCMECRADGARICVNCYKSSEDAQRREEQKRRAREEQERREQERREREAAERRARANPEHREVDCGSGVKLKLKRIEPGSFMMGSEEDSDSEPVHKVTIREPFYMGVYPVTQAQYAAVMGANPSNFDELPDAGNHPVEQVSWDEAVKFCSRLSQRSGERIELPSEAMWEYCCRAGSAAGYCFGDDESQLELYANY
jgi:hypothetical protein